MKAVNVTEQLNAMPRMFLTSEMSDSLRKNACSYWKNQDKLVDNMQTFANGWFERRHAGTHAALEAAQRMFKAETSVDLVREYQDWARGAFQRLMADGLACQQQSIAVARAIAPPLALLGSEKQTDASPSEARGAAPVKAA
ncbi:hypothetical protein [Bradyrhizobium sp.]|uniref:hypothetical protein n=1 Tax=Bradyrhizobium sp. TaxID=376 RepID=UPI002736BE0C|nr:hypothetical protein [Bradyrhizobium sp.]MDP3074918.1 hypothetical protein [Bradyrhizobium sp.]